MSESLGPVLRDAALKTQRLEQRFELQSRCLDTMLDMVNDLYTWAADTQHEDAALEVLAVIDQYHKRPTKIRI